MKKHLSKGPAAVTAAAVATLRHHGLLEKCVRERTHRLSLQVFDDKSMKITNMKHIMLY